MSVLCIRVLTISRGWTRSVAMEPADRPAMVSTRAGEKPSWFRVIEVVTA